MDDCTHSSIKLTFPSYFFLLYTHGSVSILGQLIWCQVGIKDSLLIFRYSTLLLACEQWSGIQSQKYGELAVIYHSTLESTSTQQKNLTKC